MKKLLINLYIIFNIIEYTHKAYSYKIYILEKNGYVKNVKERINIIKKYTESDLWLLTQIDRFLRKHKHSNFIKKQNNIKNKRQKTRGLMNAIQSPAIFSNGRFTLDLDRINIENIKNLNKRTEKHIKDIDSFENNNDYNNFLVLKQAKIRNNRNRKRQMQKLKNNNSFRKLNPILTNEGKKVLIALLKNKLRNKKEKAFFKRFRVVKNNDKRDLKRNSISNNAWNTFEGNENFNNDFNNSFEFLEEYKNNKKSEEFSSKEPSEEDNIYYIQGNILIKPKDTKIKRSNYNNENFDRRKRLPHFMPKRYHWASEELQDLGYFWFNGPKGKYPYPTNLN